MESKQKNVVADVETKKQLCSSSTTIKIFADTDIDKSEKQRHELPCRYQKPANSNVFADASNKTEVQQKQKKKRYGQNNKRKYKNKNKHIWSTTANNVNNANTNNANTNGDANIHTTTTNNKSGGDFDRDHTRNGSNYHRNHYYHDHYHQRGINQEFLPYEEGMGTTMIATRNDSTGFQMPFTEFIPGNRYTIPFFHPHQQLQHHLYSDDGNAKVLLEHHTNGGGVNAGDRDGVYNNSVNFNGTDECSNWVAPSCLTTRQQTCSWVDMIDDNTHVDGVVVIHEGQSKIVSIPPDVGACLVKELLVRRENFKTTSQYDHDLNRNVNTRTEQRRPVQKKNGVRGTGDQEIASLASANHQASPFIQRDSPLSLKTSSGYPHSRSLHHQRPNSHFDHHPHHGSNAPGLNLHQPYDGYGSLPLPSNTFGIHRTPSTSYHPMIQQHYQYPSMHSPHHPGMMQFTAPHEPLGWTAPGYGRLDDFNVDGNYTGNGSGEAIREKHYDKDEGISDKHNHASENKNNKEATTNRIGMNRDDVVEGGNLPQNHNYHNHNAVTPHRGAIGDNDEGDPRRVSFSPVNPLPLTPATAGEGNV